MSEDIKDDVYQVDDNNNDFTPEPVKIISMGHTGAIRSVALSADAKLVLSGSDDNTVRLWDLDSGRSRVFEGHTNGVLAVALSADAKRAISCSDDETIRIWDLDSGHSQILTGHTDRVYDVALSADGKLALSASADDTVCVWNLDAGLSLTLTGHTASVFSVALSADGKLALSGSADNTIRVWDLETGLSRVLDGHTDNVWSVDLSPDGRLAISSSFDQTIRIWDLDAGLDRVLVDHIDSVWSVALSADGKRAVFGSEDAKVHILDLDTGLSRTFSGHTRDVFGVAVRADGKVAISGSGDKTIRVWDLDSYSTRALACHTNDINGVAFGADGKVALSSSSDNTIRIWDLDTGLSRVLAGHTSQVWGLALSVDARRALSASGDGTVRVWDMDTGQGRVLEGHTHSAWSVALSANGRVAISGSTDNNVHISDLDTGLTRTFTGHTDSVMGVALSANGKRAFSGSDDNTVRVWDLDSGLSRALTGHTGRVWSVALSADGKRAISGSTDNTVRVWDLESGRSRVLEGHTDKVLCVALSADGKLAISGSYDTTVRLWDLESGRSRALKGHTTGISGVAFSADGKLAISAAINGVARVWPVDHIALKRTTRYTNAKVVLVGESGVGKTGLAMRLCEDRWEATESTHGMKVAQLKYPAVTSSDEIEREVWLWDFAGQPDYRLIHQLYMDETALGILVFDPQDDNPFEALSHWERALHSAIKRKGPQPAKLLVAARCDRGSITVSNRRFDDFIREHDCVALHITGAKTGEGCDDLKAAIAKHIPWAKLTPVTTTRLFKLLKDALLKLKDQGTPLIRLSELRGRLQLMLPDEAITEDQLRTVVSLMQGQGMVQMLDFGNFVLLQPEQINCYASVVVRMARENKDELGTIAEQQVLDGQLDYKDMSRLSADDEEILLRAMVQALLDRALCLREETPKGRMLVFPSYFRRDKPEAPEYPDIFVTYGFAGPLDEIYTTLIVKLSLSEGFKKDQLWKDTADFKTPAEKRVGLAMRRKAESAAELVVYFEQGVPDDTKVIFIKYVHEHLLARAQDVTRVRAYICPYCNTPLENRKAIEIRLKKGLKDVVCAVCEQRVILVDLIEEKFASDEFRQRVREMDEQAQINLDNESRELILVGESFTVAGQAGQIFRPTSNSDWGLDGEIEFKDHSGNASGERLYLQLKSGDSYLQKRKKDDEEIFTIKNERWADYWQRHKYPVMLVIRTSDAKIRWMNVTEYLKRASRNGTKAVRQIVFDGEPFTVASLLKMRDRVIPPQ